MDPPGPDSDHFSCFSPKSGIWEPGGGPVLRALSGFGLQEPGGGPVLSVLSGFGLWEPGGGPVLSVLLGFGFWEPGGEPQCGTPNVARQCNTTPQPFKK